MRVLLATGEHRQQKGSKAYTPDICKTGLSQKKIYFQLHSNSGLIRARSQPHADGSAGAAKATKAKGAAARRGAGVKKNALRRCPALASLPSRTLLASRNSSKTSTGQTTRNRWRNSSYSRQLCF